MSAPFCVIKSVPAESRANEMVFDASLSLDFAGAACKEFVFDFGDGSKPVSTRCAVQTHAMRESRAFVVRETCVDEHGNKGHGQCTQSIMTSKSDGDAPSTAAASDQSNAEKRVIPVVVAPSDSIESVKGKVAAKYPLSVTDRPSASRTPMQVH